ncbi:hypothetical protein GGR28_001501 [Lewinella aquimaris]|uniref:Uncharacterized protein n=1 Tax=Neolewinella aquimaris TaxID=1835722 RepID=A0A840E039_9BACT|nr:hypothetical protein [Neolewinella aquimaris]MBB4078884.1 hypothetical protein [Neolewinella aquimaris]
MGANATARPLRRPVYIASFGKAIHSTDATPQEEPEVVVDSEPQLRHDFPHAGDCRQGGISDGYRFVITFAAGRTEQTYGMIREFLREQGYGDVPIPADLTELRAFRLPPKLRHQLSLFGEDGYVHNPLKILFPPVGSKRGSLVLELYNEAAAGHLLRFHRRGKCS